MRTALHCAAFDQITPSACDTLCRITAWRNCIADWSRHFYMLVAKIGISLPKNYWHVKSSIRCCRNYPDLNLLLRTKIGPNYACHETVRTAKIVYWNQVRLYVAVNSRRCAGAVVASMAVLERLYVCGVKHRMSAVSLRLSSHLSTGLPPSSNYCQRARVFAPFMKYTTGWMYSL